MTLIFVYYCRLIVFGNDWPRFGSPFFSLPRMWWVLPWHYASSFFDPFQSMRFRYVMSSKPWTTRTLKLLRTGTPGHRWRITCDVVDHAADDQGLPVGVVIYIPCGQRGAPGLSSVDCFVGSFVEQGLVVSEGHDAQKQSCWLTFCPYRYLLLLKTCDISWGSYHVVPGLRGISTHRLFDMLHRLLHVLWLFGVFCCLLPRFKK